MAYVTVVSFSFSIEGYSARIIGVDLCILRSTHEACVLAELPVVKVVHGQQERCLQRICRRWLIGFRGVRPQVSSRPIRRLYLGIVM